MGIYDKYKKLILPLTSVKTQVTTALPGVIGKTVTTGLGNEGIDLAIWINEKLQDNTIEIPGLAELIQLTGMPEGSTTLGSFNGNIIPDNSTIKQALQILETAVMGAGGGSGLNGIYTGSGDIASNVVANVTDSFSINTGASDFVKIGDINGVLSNDFNSINGIGLEINSQGYAKLGKVFSQTGYAPSLYISKEELSLVHDYNNHLTFTSTEFPVLKTDKTQFNIWGAYNNFKGLVYKADYSNNYVDRSLVDKAYVDLKSQIVADGDKGDITISNNGTVWLVNNSVLTYNKLQNTTGSKLLGRYDSTTGTIQEIALGTGLAFVNNTLVSTGGSGSILLTTNNSSGPATLNSGTLNIPNYSLTGLGGVPTTRTITINGETYDLSQNRSWTINSMIYPSAGIPVSTGSAWGTSIVNNSTNWNTAFSWGNHALAGYLTSYTETDPTVPSHVKAITTTNISNWNNAYGWGNHATQGYLTSASIDAVPTNSSTNAVSSNGVFDALSFKADLVGGKVPAIQLPSYVDDVLEGYYNGTSFFIDSGFSTIMTPETGKIYINLFNNTSYRYTGSVYVQISNTVSSLNDLTDVTIGTLNNGQILQYNGTTSQWENVSVTIGSGDMQKSVYDIDNDGVVDYAETISVTVRNNSSTDTLRRGTIVYLSGSTGNRPNAFKAQANSESTSSGTFGVVINDINTNGDGLVAAMGTLHNLDTRTGAGGNPNPFTSDTLVDGDILWLDPTTAGYVTKTKPSAPNHAVFIGIVAATSPTNGRIVYKIQNGYEVEELHNVKITAPLLNNQVLRYTQSTGLWENKTLNFQTPLTLTTNGTSGAATLAGDGVLNIPNYSAAPGGSNTEVQFNNSGVFGGSSKFTWSNDILSLNTLTSSVSPILQLSSYFGASGNDGKIGTRIYNVGQDLSPNRSMTTLNFDVASEPMTNWQTAMSLVSEFDINDNLQNVTLSVNGGLSLTNIPLITTDATNILGVNTSGSLGKLSLDSSTLSLSSAGVLSGVIKTLNDLTDVIAPSPMLNQLLRYNGTNWVNQTLSNITYSNNASGVEVSSITGAERASLLSLDGNQTVNVTNSGVELQARAVIGSSTFDAGALLTLDSNSKGLLLPRLTTAQITTNLSSATDGMMVYDSTTQSFKGRANGTWGSLGSGGGGISGSGTANQIAFWSGTTALTGSTGLVWDDTTKSLTFGGGTATTVIRSYTSGATNITVNNGAHLGSRGINITGGGIGIEVIGTLGMYSSNVNGAAIYAKAGFSSSNIPLGMICDRAFIANVQGFGNYIANTMLQVRGMGTSTGITFLTQQSGGTNTFTILDNGQISIGPNTPNDSAILDISSTSKGFLPPRMSTAVKSTITSPAQGLVVFDTTLNTISVYNGAIWKNLSDGTTGGVISNDQSVVVTTSTQTINFDNGINAFVTLQSSTSLTLQSTSRGTFVLRITQDGTGNRFINWPANIKWSGNVAPTLTTTAGATDIITLVYDNTYYYGTYALNF